MKIKNDLKEIMQPHTIKSKNNDCGTAPGNLVFIILRTFHEDVKMNTHTRNGEFTTLLDTTTILNPNPHEQYIFVKFVCVPLKLEKG